MWEWHVWDHLIQDFDDKKANYGNVGMHPERVDLNYAKNGNADWLHFNSLDYHPGLDQILVSSPFFNEIWVIDHSTTTAEAAGSQGGLRGRGGDLIYRWGNPAAYRAGTAEEIFGQIDFSADEMLEIFDNVVAQAKAADYRALRHA